MNLEIFSRRNVLQADGNKVIELRGWVDFNPAPDLVTTINHRSFSGLRLVGRYYSDSGRAFVGIYHVDAYEAL